ncbi:MAG: PAS domain S-box protein, partial [Rubrivivax sp.]
MLSPRAPAPPRPARSSRMQRLAGRWWRRQSPSRQDRFVTLAPLASVLLFLAAIISAFWYLRNEEFERETESVKRDIEVTQQQIGLRLIQNQEQLVRLAGELAQRKLSDAAFDPLAEAFARERPEITHVAWYDARRTRRAVYWALLYHSGLAPNEPADAASGAASPAEGRDTEPELAYLNARQHLQPAYSRAFRDASGATVFQLYVPLIEGSDFGGALVAEYAVDALLRYEVPSDVAARHRISIIDLRERVLASTVTSMPGQVPPPPAIVHDAPLVPALNGLLLRGQGYRTSIGLIGNTLFWMVVLLSVLTVWMLLGSWRHMRRRTQIQSALVQETNFRRAMENSMPTGMRAMDLEGRITYVNAAFCGMVGFTEAELIGRLPPFPYWPPDRIEENHRLLQQELQGRSPAGGIEVRVMRKDGSQFDARMYISPLIDPKGQQTGWMTSITNIT